ncbi:MAG: FUSC family protein [Nitrospirales bacterium]|nr:FUSC family protein [Nitrospira sp.]MDR4501630.1 FUSC family protein [Nitrospirales bacterium]
MIPLSRRTKEAIKTGLAMTTVFAAAFYFNWKRPEWGGLAVIMLGLTATMGQSLNKGILRISGTVLGATAGLVYLGFFPQDRWLLLLCYSLHHGICVYMITGKKDQYFWHITSFVAMTIIIGTGGSSKGAFDIAMARLEENATGILIYTLIVVFLWPRNSVSDLKTASRKLMEVQSRLYRVRSHFMMNGVAEDIQPLQREESGLLLKVGQALEAGKVDSNQVFAQRYRWQRFLQLSTSLKETREILHQNFSEIQSFNLIECIPDLERFLSGLDLRFQEIERLMNDGAASSQVPSAFNVHIDDGYIQRLSPFQRASVLLIKTELERLETLSRSLFECVLGLNENISPVPSPQKKSPMKLSIDPDRLMGAVKMVIVLWVGFFILIYIDPPGHAGFLYLAVIIGQGALMLGISAKVILLPFVVGSIVTGILYIFVMPHLSGFAELGMLIFIVTFIAHYLFALPQQGLLRLGVMLPFVAFTFLENHQAYDFAVYANSVIMLMLSISINIAVDYFFSSTRPEKMFLRLLARFYRCCGFLLLDLAHENEPRQSLKSHYKAEYYYYNLLSLPEKLAKYAQRIDYHAFPNNKPEQVQLLVMNLQNIIYRITMLMDAKKYPQDKWLASHLHGDVQDLCLKLGEQFRRWSDNPTVLSEKNLPMHLAAQLDTIETQFKEASASISQENYDHKDRECLYQSLGNYRGLAEAVIGYAHSAGKFDFETWREARF